MYTKAAVRVTGATFLPMWGVECSGIIPRLNMVADFRDTGSPRTYSWSTISICSPASFYLDGKALRTICVTDRIRRLAPPNTGCTTGFGTASGSPEPNSPYWGLGIPGGAYPGTEVCLGVPRGDGSEIHRFVEY